MPAVREMSLDELLDRIELSQDIEISRREFAEDKSIPQDVVFNRLHEKLLAMKQFSTIGLLPD